MKENTLTRSYSLRVCRDRLITSLLDKTYKIYNVGAAFFGNFWLDLLGGVKPTHFDDNPDFVLPLWFTLESASDTPSIAPEQVPVLFKKYWLDSGGSPEQLETDTLRHFFDTVSAKTITKDADGKEPKHVWLSHREGARWVDRFQRSIQLRKELGLTPEDITRLVTDESFPLNSGDAESVRQMISSWWGTGQKTDWEKTRKVAEQIRVFFNKVKPNSHATQVGVALFKELGINATCADLQKLMGKKGNPGVLKLFVNLLDRKEDELTSEEIDVFINAAQTIEKRSNKDYSQKPWMENLRKKFESVIGVPFQTTTRTISEETCAMFGLAVERHLSWHSWCVRQLKERTESASKAFATYRIHPSVENATLKHREGNFLSLRQFRGIGKFLAMCENNQPLDEVLDELTRSTEIGDVAMFVDLAKAAEGIPYDEVKESINNLIDREKALNKFYTLFTPCFRHIDKTSSVHPRFGNSKPRGELELGKQPLKVYKRNEGGDLRIYADMMLFDGERFDMHRVPLLGKRFRNEIYYDKDATVEAARDNSLTRKNVGQNVKMNVVLPSSANREELKANVALLLRPGLHDWYIDASVKVKPLPRTKDITEAFMQDGASLLSIDLGQRNAAAFCHYKTDSEGDVVVFNEKRQHQTMKLSIVEKGLLNDPRLNDSSRPTNEDDIKVWNELYDACGGGNFQPPKTILALNKDIANFAKKIAKAQEIPEAKISLFKAMDQVMGVVGDRKHQIGRGKLSFGRMETIENLLSAFNTLKSRSNDVEIDKTINLLRARLNNIRRERARLTAHVIVDKALSVGAKLLVIEDLDIAGNQSSTKKMNRKNTNWCARRIINMLAGKLNEKKRREQNGSAAEYGITVKSVFPAGSSMEDFLTGEYKCRFSVMNVADFDKKWGRQLLQSVLRQPTGQRESVARRFVMTKLREYHAPATVAGLIGVLKNEAVDGKVYFPKMGGPLYHSDKFGWIESDVAAAMTLGVRGLKFLLGWLDRFEASDDDKKRTKNTRIPKINIMRISEECAKMSWGVVKSTPELALTS